METRGVYQSLANRIRIDMDSRNPKLRLSVIGYFVEAGITPHEVGGQEEWMDLVEDTVEYIGAEFAEFVASVENLTLPEQEEDDKDADKNAYEVLKLDDHGGYRLENMYYGFLEGEKFDLDLDDEERILESLEERLEESRRREES